MLENKEYCDYETCIILKELGYNYPLELITDYCGALDIPFHDQKIHIYDAQKWLREVKKIDVGATWDNDEDNWFSYIKQMGFPDWSGTSVSHSCYPSYEEALLEGIKETIKILKDERSN